MGQARGCLRSGGRPPQRIASAGKATTEPDEIVKAVSYARVDTLFLAGDDHL
jgi:hypothetical protein